MVVPVRPPSLPDRHPDGKPLTKLRKYEMTMDELREWLTAVVDAQADYWPMEARADGYTCDEYHDFFGDWKEILLAKAWEVEE